LRTTLRLALVLPVVLASLALPQLAAPAFADEGMWIPLQIPGLVPILKQKGFTGDANAFADLTGHPMGAIISLGGCSASFISPDGLIATNHHCAQGALQYNSTPERDLITNGFLARDRASELWNGPGARVSVTVSFREVTDEIVGGLDPKLADRARHDEIERRVKARTAECEKGGLRCRVESFFEGLRWYEQAQMEIEDVRLVYAPPAGVGNFGGEVDNWQWPRHTGDWSLFRAWVDPKGKPAPHSPKNVPYKPKQWLKVSTRGASPGQLVFVAGYPGSTSRHAIAAEIREEVEWNLPRQIRLSKEQLDLLAELSKDDRDLGIKVTQRVRGLANGMKNAEGTLSGLVLGGALATKEGREKALAAWIDSDPERKAKWGGALTELAAIQAETERSRERDATFRSLFRASSLLGAADTIHRNSIERTKKDADREPEFQERNQARIRERLERMEKSYSPTADRALLRWAVRKAQQLPAEMRIGPLDQAVGLRPGQPDAEAATAIDAWLDRLYAGTKLGETKARLAWLDPKKTTKQIGASGDPFLDLAIALHPVGESLRDEAKARDGRRSRVAPAYMEALLQKEGGRVAPDANGTLRFTYGTVEGWQVRDGLYYLPQTTLRGVVAKNTGEGDFDVPDNVLEAAKKLHAGGTSPYVDPRLGDVPVDYLSTVDTTGGNSGSATLDDKGEFCGLLFDGLMESLSSDVVFDEKANRSIHVDSRYLLWTLSEVEKATNLLKEMGVE
jgi:hypothetical protein